MYYIYDELGDLMRKVKRKEEAKQLINLRDGWSFKYIFTKRKPVDLSQFEECPF